MPADTDFVMTPEEIQQCVAAPELQDFYHDNAIDEAAIEKFIKRGDSSRVPGIVAAMPSRLRAFLKNKLQHTMGVRLFTNGRALLDQL